MHMLYLRALTSQIAYKVIKAHFALGFDVGRVHVSVEEDHSEGQDEDGVRVVKLLHHIRITHTVPLAGGQKIGQQSYMSGLASSTHFTTHDNIHCAVTKSRQQPIQSDSVADWVRSFSADSCGATFQQHKHKL